MKYLSKKIDKKETWLTKMHKIFLGPKSLENSNLGQHFEEENNHTFKFKEYTIL